MSWLRRLLGREAPGEPADPREAFLADREAADTPWAMFEVDGLEGEGGQVAVRFSWNQPFLERIRAMGFQGETAEDCVQLFFYASQMRPTELADDAPVQPDDLPYLRT